MQKTELKPCPFCGGEALASYDSDDYPVVECQSCCARTDWFDHIYNAIEAWNKRVNKDEKN